MLKLKCSICLNTLINQDSGPIAAPCGHIYCQTCMDKMSRTRDKTNCALCRHSFSIGEAVKLFVEYEESQPNPAPPLTASQINVGEAVIEACQRVGENAGEEEALQMIVSAEKLLIDIEETHGNTDAEEMLKLIGASLGELRKKLKLFSRMNSLQQEKSSLEQERDSLRQVVVDQLKEVDDAVQAQTKLARHLKRTSSELEMHQNREYSKQQANAYTVQELTEELQSERVRSARYKKKYHAALQKSKEAKPRSTVRPGSVGGHLSSETELSDDSLEIISPPNSQPQSDSATKASLMHSIRNSSRTEPAGDLKSKRKAGSSGGTEMQSAGPSRKKVRPPTTPNLGIIREDSAT